MRVVYEGIAFSLEHCINVQYRNLIATANLMNDFVVSIQILPPSSQTDFVGHIAHVVRSGQQDRHDVVLPTNGNDLLEISLIVFEWHSGLIPAAVGIGALG